MILKREDYERNVRTILSQAVEWSDKEQTLVDLTDDLVFQLVNQILVAVNVERESCANMVSACADHYPGEYKITDALFSAAKEIRARN